MNRKAMSGTTTFLLSVIFLIILAAIFIPIIAKSGKDTQSLFNCPGACVEKELGCASPRTEFNAGICPNKELQVCCATIEEIAGIKQQGQTTSNGTIVGTSGSNVTNTSTGKGYIELRINDDISPVGSGIMRSIPEGENTRFHIWVHSGPAKKCSAKFLDENGNDVTSGPFSQRIDITDCVGEQNKKTLTINPVFETNTKTYKLQVLLYGDQASSEADRLESAHINVRVSRAVCPYSSCIDITDEEICRNAHTVPGCTPPAFSCTWHIIEGCKNRII